jgi:predicted type IV restriction endonuclease
MPQEELYIEMVQLSEENMERPSFKQKIIEAHFIALDEHSEYYISEAEGDQYINADIMAAEKQPKVITKTRKEAFDGVLLPPQ